MQTPTLASAVSAIHAEFTAARRELRSPTMVLALAALVMIAVGSRLINVAPNVTAVAAVALLAGVMFSSRVLAAGVVMASMALSDAIIGGYSTVVMLAVYGALALPVLFRPMLGDRPFAGVGLARVGAAAVLASTIFFLSTNFAVWASGTIGYARTFSGLAECYVNALPFFRMTMLGDVVFSVALFGAVGLIRRTSIVPVQSVAAA